MPYDKEKQAAYMRERYHKNRNKFFKNKKCAKCGSKGKLELDHIDPESKITHRVWYLSEKRREIELAKCQILCRKCHLLKSKTDLAKMNSELSNDDVIYIKDSNKSCRVLAKEFNTNRMTVSRIKNNKAYT